jgi:hypothetical protein
MADAGHSLSDLLGDFVTLFCWRLSRRPKSDRYPHGASMRHFLPTKNPASAQGLASSRLLARPPCRCFSLAARSGSGSTPIISSSMLSTLLFSPFPQAPCRMYSSQPRRQQKPSPPTLRMVTHMRTRSTPMRRGSLQSAWWLRSGCTGSQKRSPTTSAVVC